VTPRRSASSIAATDVVAGRDHGTVAGQDADVIVVVVGADQVR
jgi:hypothetical protein